VFDHGLDNCPDSLEAGNNMCSSSISIYNLAGTENNGELDWDDLDASGTWDEDEYEQWWDWGIDGCPDSLETGDGLCGVEENDAGISDPNGDNYNIDPIGDDYPNGKEGNGVWDEGELYKDWGSDGLPASLVGFSDVTENDGNYNIGEPFDDTGPDNLYSFEETGYNTDGTEGNNQFDGDGEYNDCGEDNICSSDDDFTDDLIYLWTAPSALLLDGVNTSAPTFTAPDRPEATDYELILVVSDGDTVSAPDTMVVTILENKPPQVSAGAVDASGDIVTDILSVDQGTMVTISPLASTAPAET
jgi:hypothetical protein